MQRFPRHLCLPTSDNDNNNNTNIPITIIIVIATARLSVVVNTTAYLHLSKSEPSLCAGSSPNRSALEIRDG